MSVLSVTRTDVTHTAFMPCTKNCRVKLSEHITFTGRKNSWVALRLSDTNYWTVQCDCGHWYGIHRVGRDFTVTAK